MKEYKPGWQTAEPVERVYVEYNPKKNLTTHAYICPNQRDKEVKVLEIDIYVTYEVNELL